jgi:hypothetical protein
MNDTQKIEAIKKLLPPKDHAISQGNALELIDSIRTIILQPEKAKAAK